VDGESVYQVYKHYNNWCSIARLHWLDSLTRLQLNVVYEECSANFWCGLAKLTTLRDLCILDLDMSYFGGIVQLVEC
jgi:hypothetical protein